MKNGRFQILLTNDDGIQSPGIWAAAEALSTLGFVTLAAPRDQASSPGRSLLLTRRPNLAMWERSKLPEGAAEAAVRDKLSRRYDLCDWTVVSTATLLTAVDRVDKARWT